MTCPTVIRVTTGTGPPGIGLPAGTADAGKLVRKAGSTAYAYELVTPDQVGLPQGTDPRPPLYATTTTYPASGAISPTDRVAVVNAASAVTMTLAAGPSDGHFLVIKRLGAGALTLTANLDGVSSSIVADSTTIRESVSLAWSSSLSTWLIL